MNEYLKFKNECIRNQENQSNDARFKDLTSSWLECSAEFKYSYNFEWLGRPIIQYPQDICAIQELVWSVRPDLIIETGIAHGGSLILSASLLAMLDYEDFVNNKTNPIETKKRMVLGVDIDIREHNKNAINQHFLSEKIEMIQGSSIDQSIIDKVSEFTKNFSTVMVFLDSNHTHQHVLAELNGYSQFVSDGSYCVVFDTVVDDIDDKYSQGRPWSSKDNPKTAVFEFLEDNPLFEMDSQIDQKLMISVAPSGFLKKLSM